MFGHKMVWDYAHSASILFAVLLFTAGFLCTLLWTNNIVPTVASSANPNTSTFTYYSPAVSTFTLTYGVAIFGTVWNSIVYVTLIILGRDTLPISTTRLRYDLQQAATIVAIIGNAIYAVACIALMATLARLAADPPNTMPLLTGDTTAMQQVKAGTNDRQAGLGATAAFAGLAAAAAMLAGLMDALHLQYSPFRDVDVRTGDENAKQA